MLSAILFHLIVAAFSPGGPVVFVDLGEFRGQAACERARDALLDDALDHIDEAPSIMGAVCVAPGKVA